ncbi:MAG: mechanosensitive ion channel family protein [Pseudomonadota bacterium]
MKNWLGFGRKAAARLAHIRAVFAIFIVLLLSTTLQTGVASGQVLNYDKLFGSSQQETAPQQSRPVQAPDRSDDPTIADYGVVATTAGDPMLSRTRQAISLFRERLKSIVTRLPGSWREIKTALAAASPTGRPGYFIGVAVFAALLLTMGRAIMWIVAVYVTRPIMIGLQSVRRTGYAGKLPVLTYRLVFTIILMSITVAMATLIGLLFYQEHEETLITVIVVFGSYAMVMVVDTIWRMAVAPYLPDARLPKITDTEARSLYGWLSITTAFAIVGMAFCFWMQALGLSSEVHTALTVLVALGSTLLLLAMFRVHRKTISKIILAGRTRETASWLTVAAVSLWAPVLTIYLLFTWGDFSRRMIVGIEDNPLRLAAPYLIFMLGLIVYVVASYVIERIFARNREMQAINAELEARRREEEQAETARLHEQITGSASGAADIDDDGDEESGGPRVDDMPQPQIPRASMQTMEDLARRTASLFAIGAVAYALIRFWGGATIFEDWPALNLVQDIIDILLVGYIVFHAVRIWIDQKIADEGGDEEPAGPGEGEGGGAGATRLATLLPLFRNFLLIVIAVTVLLLIAIEVGINVAPLFAGAGIVGLAIGFGAQTLVRDILSGAFFLMDDAFRKGEYIDVGEVKGTVEKISLRSFQLRHHLGMLHTIPFGEIQHLTNFSRDWVMMKLPLRLTYDTDVERVRKLIKKLGLRLLEDPEIGEKFIQPVKSQGVIQMDDSAMIVRIKFMTYPGEQWVLRKRIFAEIRELFEKEGIKFAHREVTVRIPDLDDRKDLSDEQMRAVGAAARRVGDQVDEEMLEPAAVGDTR